MTENPEKKNNYVENYADKNKEYPNLTSEQNKTLSEINTFIKNFTKKFVAEHNINLFNERQKKIISFIQTLEDKGFTSSNYILGCRMIGGTPEEYITEFDTSDHDIEKFMIGLESDIKEK